MTIIYTCLKLYYAIYVYLILFVFNGHLGTAVIRGITYQSNESRENGFNILYRVLI